MLRFGLKRIITRGLEQTLKHRKECYIGIVIYLYIRVLAVADTEIRKIGESYHFKIEIKIQTFESSEEVKSVRRYHAYVSVQNNIV